MKFFSLMMAAYFTLGSFFPATDFSQVAKLPNMWGHYLQHRELAIEQGERVGPIDFLRFHFYTPSEHTGEHDHDDLPFHSGNSSTTNILIPNLNSSWNSVSEVFSEKMEFFYLLNYHFNYSSTLFQPPVELAG